MKKFCIFMITAIIALSGSFADALSVEQIMAKYDANIHLLNSPNLDISSHGIRKRIRSGQSIKYLLPEEVERYIYEKGLYKKG